MRAKTLDTSLEFVPAAKRVCHCSQSTRANASCLCVCLCVCCSQEEGWGCCHGDATTEECRGRGGGRPREEEDQRSKKREERSAGQTHQTRCSDWQSRQGLFHSSTTSPSPAANEELYALKRNTKSNFWGSQSPKL